MGKKSRRAKNVPGGAAGKASGGGRREGGAGNQLQQIQASLERRGLPNPFTKTSQAELDLITSPHVVSTDENDPIKAPSTATCWICLEGKDENREPLRRSCACRGDGHYAHLSCLTGYMTSMSDSIWTGEVQIQKGANWLTCGRPWESCNNCKQYYEGSLGLDIAKEYCRATEGFVGDLKVIRHLMARGWLTKAMTRIHGMEDVLRDEFEKLLKLIKESYPIYNQASLGPSEMAAANPIMCFIESTVGKLEYETLSNYTQANHRMLIRMHQQGNQEKEMKDLYDCCVTTMNKALAKVEYIETYPSSKDPICARDLQVSKASMNAMLANIEAQFSYLDSKCLVSTHDKQKRAVALNKQTMTMMNEDRPGYTESIKYLLIHAERLLHMGCENPYEIQKILEENVPKALQMLGPHHSLIKAANLALRTLLSARRALSPVCNDYNSVVRYEDEMYVLNIDDEEIKCCPSEVILQAGALVKCVNLKGAKHLNELRGWIGSYDEKTGRHSVNFEDAHTKPCLVKPANLRLLFFREEYMLEEKGVEDDYKSKLMPR